MFGQFHHLPVHALAVHGAVVLVPLAALMAVLFAIPRFRGWALYPLPLTAIGATVAVYVAKESGEHLEGVIKPQGEVADLIDDHAAAADLLFKLMLVFALIAIVAFVLARNPAKFEGVVSIVVSAVLVIGAAGIAYQTYKVGELGAKAVWNPTETVDYG